VSARAYRIAPRRQGARRHASRVDWERFGRISLVLILFLILALYINPFVNFVDAWRDSRAESSQLAQLKAENQDLREKAQTLEHSDAAELGARRLGMVNPDERSVVICEPDGPGDCQTSAP
jgi:cell division protein FtsB